MQAPERSLNLWFVPYVRHLSRTVTFRSCTGMPSSREKGSGRLGSSSGRRSKAQRDEDEIPTALNQTHAPSSTSWSIRVLPFSVTGIQPLTTLCMHAFVGHFRKLASNETAVESFKEWILAVPDYLIPRLFAIMKKKEVYPSNGFIAAVGAK